MRDINTHDIKMNTNLFYEKGTGVGKMLLNGIWRFGLFSTATQSSTATAVSSGVLQGTVWRPMLFYCSSTTYHMSSSSSSHPPPECSRMTACYTRGSDLVIIRWFCRKIACDSGHSDQEGKFYLSILMKEHQTFANQYQAPMLQHSG